MNPVTCIAVAALVTGFWSLADAKADPAVQTSMIPSKLQMDEMDRARCDAMAHEAQRAMAASMVANPVNDRGLSWQSCRNGSTNENVLRQCDLAEAQRVQDAKSAQASLPRQSVVRSRCEQEAQSDRQLLANTIASMNATYARHEWWEDATEQQLDAAPNDAKASCLTIAKILADHYERVIQQETCDRLASEESENATSERKSRADPKVMAARAEKKREAEFFSTVVAPMCEADKLREHASADIARERANPSGVVDLNVLHEAGVQIQGAEQVLKESSAAYAARRHHPWHGWKSECQ